MKRSRLRNNFLRNGRKQRNKTKELLRLTSEKKYFANLNEKDIIDNKLFWKTIKPSFSDKVMTRDRINLFEKKESVKTGLETTEVLINSSLILSIILKFQNIPNMNLS